MHSGEGRGGEVGVVRGLILKGVSVSRHSPKTDQHFEILHSVTLKFQGQRGAGNVWRVGNMRCELTMRRKGT